jgi:hypothetical protein
MTQGMNGGKGHVRLESLDIKNSLKITYNFKQFFNSLVDPISTGFGVQNLIIRNRIQYSTYLEIKSTKLIVLAFRTPTFKKSCTHKMEIFETSSCLPCFLIQWKLLNGDHN